MTTRYRQKGFTLIELLVVLAILGIVTTATYSIFITHQRTAYVDEEMVDVQQNLRIAMDSISRDLRIAGILIPRNDAVNTPNPNPGGGAVDTSVSIARYDDNAGQLQPLDAPDNVQSDAVTLSMATVNAGMSRIIEDKFSVVVAPGTEVAFAVDESGYFSVEPIKQVVRVIRPSMPSNTISPGNVRYTVEGVGATAATCAPKAAPCLQLKAVNGAGDSVEFLPGDLIIRTGTTAIEQYPGTVAYSLTPGRTATCPADQTCLSRSENGTTQVVASNIVGLQFSYLLDGGLESSAPTDREKIRAVRVTLWGQTEDTKKLSGETRDNVGNRAKTRQVTSVIKIRNRDPRYM